MALSVRVVDELVLHFGRMLVHQERWTPILTGDGPVGPSEEWELRRRIGALEGYAAFRESEYGRRLCAWRDEGLATAPRTFLFNRAAGSPVAA
jgi:hypothetical protein